MKRIHSTVVALLAVAPVARAQSTLFALEGKNWGDQLGGGQGIAPIGDQNGDGKDDFLVAEPGYDGKAGADCGRVQLFGGTKSTPKLLATWEGENAGDRLGEFVRDVLDLDLDGVHEFAIGSRAWPGGAMRGRVDVYAGGSWKPVKGLSFTGESDGDEFGRTCGVGDVTGDKVNDLLISAVGWNRQPNGFGSGRVYLYSGKDGSLVRSWDGQPGQELGFRLAALHWDFDGDLRNDFFMTQLERGTTPPGGGRIRVCSAFQDAELWAWVGNQSGDTAAYISDAADIDADGFPEFLFGWVTAWGGQFGAVELHTCAYPGLGLRAMWIGTAELPYDCESAMAGDVDGDGWSDILLSSSGFDFEGRADVGMVRVMSGRNFRELTRHVGWQAGAPIGGEAMAGACDLDGDGRADQLVGAAGFDAASQTDVGQATAFAGDDLYLTLSHRTAYANDFVTMNTTAGVPGNPLIIALTELDGAPVWVELLMGITFDANGEYVAVPMVDASWGVHDLEFRSWAIGRNGKLVRSGIVELALR